MTKTYLKSQSNRTLRQIKKMTEAISIFSRTLNTSIPKIQKIHTGTLRRLIRLPAESLPEYGCNFRNIFTPEEKNALKMNLRDISKNFFGLTKTQCQRLVYEFAERKGLDHPFNRNNRMADDAWISDFAAEIKLDLLQFETSSHTCEQSDVDDFFRILLNLKKTYGFHKKNMYHADEICISAVPNDLTRFSQYQSEDEGCSGRMLVETRDNVTLICCANAAGSYIPPMIVFPRDKMIPGFLRGLPPGSIGYTSEKGLINSELFLTFLKHFVQHAEPSSRYPVLLLIDNYISYISLEALDFCFINNVVLMGFPINSRQRLQPLDISFFGPLKACYSHACDGFSDAYPWVKLTVDNVGEVFRTAYCRTASPENAIKGFEESGIEPFQPFSHCSPGALDKFIKRTNEISGTMTADEDSDVEIVSWVEGTSECSDYVDVLGGTEEGDANTITCLRCSFGFPYKAWIQCFSCKQWWHFNCEAYYNGKHCDYCKDVLFIALD